MHNNLEKREVNGGRVMGSFETGFEIILPPIIEKYCLAQLDNYMELPRYRFPYQPPLRFQLEARLSASDVPGTWGFGLWNDPFSIGFGMGGMTRPLPVLPNAAWFFYGSSANFLSLRQEQPASGFHVKVFKSPRFPGLFTLLALPIIPVLLIPTAARLIRRLARLLIKEDSIQVNIATTEWHLYDLSWFEDQVSFCVDGIELYRSRFSPAGPLGLLIWMDNQYLHFDSSGKLGYGFEEITDQQLLQIRNLSIMRN
jgi:hypothetical protein